MKELSSTVQDRSVGIAPHAASPVPFERDALVGAWYNQRGSELVLDVDAEGQLSGSFRSHGGLAKAGEPCRVTGYVSGDLIAFVVDFERFDSLTAWTGHLVVEAGETRIRACWHMSVVVPMRHLERELWRGTWTGEDEFRRASFGVTESTSGSHPLPDWP